MLIKNEEILPNVQRSLRLLNSGLTTEFEA